MKPGSQRGYKAGLATSIVVLLALVARIQPALNTARGQLGLTEVTPLENAPPVLAFTTVALGGFRGIIANSLWIRANDLEEKGKYFEAMQLADWITKLQPRMVQVWTVQAWNMAYNISVKFTAHEDKWRWVKAGTELLRDEALKYNPGEPLIYRELAWFFQHKMGHYLDSAHMYYKRQWATEMLPFVGRERPNWEELLNPQTEEAKARVRRLREVYKMDPAIMKQIDDEYGPLEWKLPETHAIYWATVGLQHAKDKNKDTLRRVIYQSMDVAFQRGRVRIFFKDDKINEFFMGPNLDILAKTDQAFLDMMKLENKTPEQYTGYRSFLRKAVYNLYSHNRTVEAEAWWKKLKEVYPDAVRDGIGLDEWAVEMVSEDSSGTDQNKSMAAIEGQVSMAFFNLALGENEQAQVNAGLARRIWTRYMQKVGCLKEKPNDECARVRLPDLNVIRDVISDTMLDIDSPITPEARARLLTALKLPADYNPRAGRTNAPAALGPNPPPQPGPAKP